MNRLLPAVTTFFDLVALAATLSLGLYIVTRSPRSRVSWLAALTLWCVALFFFHNALAINMPGSSLLPWLQPTMLLVPALWFHLSIELVQERAQQQGRAWTTGAAVRRLAVVLAYAAGVALLLLSIVWLGGRVVPLTSAGLHAAERASDPLYPFTTAYVVLVASFSLANLWRGYRRDSSDVRRRQFRPLVIATVLAALGGVYVTVGIGLGIDLPELPRDLAFGVAVALLGFAVARHNALVEGRVIEADLLYVFLAVGSLTAAAVLLAELLYSAGHVFSFVTLVLVMVVTICALMLYDGVRTALDRLFYRDQYRHLRANLRSLANEAGAGLSLPEQLQAVLDRLCATLAAERGLIALASDGKSDRFVIRASHNAAPVGCEILAGCLLRGEIAELPACSLPPPGADAMHGMVLLAPIAAGGSQAGALLLGPRSGQQRYEDEDLMLLDDVAGQLATVIHTSQMQEENARAINGMVSEFRERERALQRQVQEMLAAGGGATEPGLAGLSHEAFTGQVEDALRRLHDYPALGEHPLTRLALVRQHLAASQADGAGTHIDRGKALHRVLVDAIDKLRPEGVPPNPHNVPPREWHQFIILHDSYVLDEPNRDIMSRLYIGEGTFNRTRRRALQGVAKALQEMEQAA